MATPPMGYSGRNLILGPFRGGERTRYGLPASVAAALAQRDSTVLVLDIQSDGDLMYTSGALWTAARHGLPLLIVIYNNRSYGKDELHQREMAHTRRRSVDTVGIGNSH